MFYDIALTIIAFHQSSLVTYSSYSDEHGRLNVYILARQSSFIKTLIFKLDQPNLSPNIGSQEAWLSRRVLAILGLMSPEVERFVDCALESLRNEENYDGNMIGGLLSIYSNRNSSSDIETLFQFLATCPGHLTSDIEFLEGFERILLKMPK